MIRSLIALLSITTLSLSPIAYAQDPVAEFATCMTDSLNGKQRKEMAKWIYLSISVHPLLKDLSASTDETRDEQNKYLGALVTELLTESCPEEVVKANKADPLAIQKGFEILGQVAMQELMNNPDTLTAISAYAKYIDETKIGKLLTQ